MPIGSLLYLYLPQGSISVHNDEEYGSKRML